MRRNRKLMWVLVLAMIIIVSGCSSKKSASNDTKAVRADVTTVKYGAAATEQSSSASEPISDIATNSKAIDSSAIEEGVANTSVLENANSYLNSNDKIIRRANLEVETQDFDKMIQSLNNSISQLNGYVESSEIRGKYYNSNDLRYGNIIARIPKSKFDEFIGTVYEVGNVVNKQESTENVTLAYVDTQSHKKALEIEQERLLELLKKVKSLEDIITLETRLSSIRYDLQNYESQLRTYDNQVEYSTITLNIQEVERITNVVETKQTVWSRTHTGFGETMYTIGVSLQNFFVWFIVNLPYLIIWAVIIAFVILISSRYYKKNVKNISKETNNETNKETLTGLQNQKKDKNS